MTIECVALIGPRAAGKSTLAAALGDRLGWPVQDTDALLEASVGCPAGEHLARVGERRFRSDEEPVCLCALAPGARRVVALGGGAVLSPAVRAGLQRPGVFVVFVEAPVATLLQRQMASPDARPPLTDLSLEDEVREVLRVRRPFYGQLAHLHVDTNSSNADTCAVLILDKMDEAR